MCGIVGYVGKKQAAPILLDGLSKLEYRGYDSAGLAVRSDSGNFDAGQHTENPVRTMRIRTSAMIRRLSVFTTALLRTIRMLRTSCCAITIISIPTRIPRWSSI